MGKLNITIHPLFFIFGIYFALIGKVFSFLVYVLTALVHELGHYFVSERCGYQLKRIVLMPYGAVISGDVSIRYKDEIEIAFAGPAVNFLIVLFFVALWWVVPDVYPYTAEVVAANLTIATINLLPCYPLDGGRILLATLSLYLKRSTAEKISKGIGVALAAALFGLFVYSCFVGVNITLLFFSLFMLGGALSRSAENSYIRVYAAMSAKRFRRGVEVKKVAISRNSTVKQLYSLIGSATAEVAVVDEDGKINCTLNFFKVQRLLESSNLYEPLDSALARLRLS